MHIAVNKLPVFINFNSASPSTPQRHPAEDCSDGAALNSYLQLQQTTLNKQSGYVNRSRKPRMDARTQGLSNLTLIEKICHSLASDTIDTESFMNNAYERP